MNAHRSVSSRSAIARALGRSGTALALALAGFAIGRLIASGSGTSGTAAAIGGPRSVAPRLATPAAAVAAPSEAAELAASARFGEAAPSPSTAVDDASAQIDALVARLDGHPGPAYRRYLVDLLTRKALAEPGVELELLERARFERDPDRLAALGEALLGYYRATQDDRIPAEAAAALGRETDPARQRALVRFLGSIPGVALAVPDFAERCAALATDSPDAATRAAAAAALATQAVASASSGRGASPATGEDVARLVEVAARASDPGAARRLLEAADLRHAAPESVDQVAGLLDAVSPEVRRGAARALSGAAPAARRAASAALVRRVRHETDPGVRESLVDALVRLDLGEARPLLASLRGLDPALDARIDRYDNVLALGLSEWRLVQRELGRS